MAGAGAGRDEEKAWIVAESLDPATTVSAVARRYGLHASQLFTWRQQLAAPAGVRGSRVRAGGGGGGRCGRTAEMAGRMEIALGPAVVRVGADVDAAALRRVLEVVRGLR